MTRQPLRKTRSRKGGADRIEALAERYRLKTRIDRENGARIVPGQLGHLYEYDSDLLGVIVMSDPAKKPYWNRSRSKLPDAEFVILQNGDLEGSAAFGPDNPAQANLAIKIADARRRFPFKPRRMHWRTYRRVSDEYAVVAGSYCHSCH